LNLVSYHTNVLAEHGVLELVRTQRRRGGTAHYYRSTVPEIIEEEGWAALPSPVRRALVRGSLATIAEETHVAALSGGFDGASAHVSRWPVTLDDQAVGEVTGLLRTLLDDLARIQVESGRRAGDPLGHYEVVLMAFAAGPEAVD
jgi:DNA-binding transcriptional ArsR family regulator